MTESPEHALAFIEWVEAGWFEVDAATCGLGDASAGAIPTDRYLEVARDIGLDHDVFDFTGSGVPFVAVNTGEDAPYPLELARDAAGRLIAARVTFTNDVDQLDGKWVPAGRVEVSSGLAIAGDPFCEGPLYHQEFDCPEASYAVEVFEFDRDHLGIRMFPVDSSAP